MRLTVIVQFSAANPVVGFHWITNGVSHLAMQLEGAEIRRILIAQNTRAEYLVQNTKCDFMLLGGRFLQSESVLSDERF